VALVRGYRYLILRRATQGGVLFLFYAGNVLGWTMLKGNLSTSELLDEVTLADPFAVLQVLATGTIVATEALVGAGVVALFFVLLGGRVFCSWVCPVNVVTDGANWLRKVFRNESAERTLPLARSVRYWTLGLSLALSTLLGVAAFEWVSPISMLHRGVIFGMGLGWTAVLAVFLFDLFVVTNGFCGHICPLGGFYSVVGAVSLLRVRHDRDKCTRCMKCIEVCPERQVLPMVGKRSDVVRSGECTNCARCIEVCPDRAMKFGTRFASGKTGEKGE
jgi:ferredoxin-type protein NapH